MHSIWEKQKAASNECHFYTLRVVGSYIWSRPGENSRVAIQSSQGGQRILLEAGDLVVDDATPGKLHISWAFKSVDATLKMELDESQIKLPWQGVTQ